jgi:hypothetical protein
MRKKRNQIDLQYLDSISNLKFHKNGAKILRLYTKFFSNFYAEDLEHYEGIVHAPIILRTIAKRQWQNINENKLSFYLKQTKADIIKNGLGSNLNYIQIETSLPLETIRRKVNLMINKGWLFKNGFLIYQTDYWLKKHIPQAIATSNDMIEFVESISKLLSK